MKEKGGCIGFRSLQFRTGAPTRLSPAGGWPYSIAPRIPPGRGGIIMGCGPKMNPTQHNPSQPKAGCMGVLLGRSHGHFGNIWGSHAVIWAYPGVVEVHLDPSGSNSGDIWTHCGSFGPSEGHPGMTRGHLGHIRGHPGVHGGPREGHVLKTICFIMLFPKLCLHNGVLT